MGEALLFFFDKNRARQDIEGSNDIHKEGPGCDIQLG